MTKEEAYKYVLDDMSQVMMFTGIYDAEHGSDKFMSGISTVMEWIAYNVSDEVGIKFSDAFLTNRINSELRANAKKKSRNIDAVITDIKPIETGLVIHEDHTTELFHGFIIQWEGSNCFGNYTVYQNKGGDWIGESECMDNNEDKDFLKHLLAELVANITIIE